MNGNTQFTYKGRLELLEASDRVFKFVDFADMLKRPEMSPEAREQRERGRRRGYRDGWIDCLSFSCTLPISRLYYLHGK
jgi:hypothetical protein